MDIREKEEALFGDWRVGLPSFVTDGAVDPGAYLSSWPKILFLLKEVNDKNGGGVVSSGAPLQRRIPSQRRTLTDMGQGGALDTRYSEFASRNALECHRRHHG